MTRRNDRLGFLTDRAAFVRRFVLAEVLGPRRGLSVRPPRRPVAPPVPSTTTPSR